MKIFNQIFNFSIHIKSKITDNLKKIFFALKKVQVCSQKTEEIKAKR